MNKRTHLWATIGLVGAAVLMPLSAIADDEIDFTRDIRPILSNACFECHGPDADQREADLRLDSRQGAFAKKDGHAAFVAGDVEASEALRRISSADPDERMPPPDSGKKLTGKQVELLAKWVRQGARWSRHWAFVAPERPNVPASGETDWVQNPIDAFILKGLKRENLDPSLQTDKVTLLRRLSLDLVGLPPSIEEVDAFLADESPDAYRKQVERLLESEHYGERWGRHWLDAARYADSDGFEKDKPRSVWFYRDWVIDALNRDLPYDQFIIEQIAGDLLPDATQDQVVATGFLRNSMINEEGGIDPEQFRMEAMFDRMDAIGKAVLGVTVQCGQCHSHKYDPLTQQDYYRMFAFLNNCEEACVTVYTKEQRQRRREILEQIAGIEKQLRAEMPKWRRLMHEWEAGVRNNQPKWTTLSIDHQGDMSQRYFPQPDGSLLALGYAPTSYDAVFVAQTKLATIRAFKVEAFTDPNLPASGPGRALDGLFALTEFRVEVPHPTMPGEKSGIKFSGATADYGNERMQLGPRYADRKGKRGFTGPVEYALDNKLETAWGIDAGPGRRNQAREAVFVAEGEITLSEDTQITIHLVQKHGGWNSDDNKTMNLGRFRVSVTGDENAEADRVPDSVREIFDIPEDQRTDQQVGTVFRYWRTTVPRWKAANDQIESLWREHPEGATQLVLRERDQTRPTHRLDRGDFLKPKERVTPGVPEFLHDLPQNAAPTRLTFARWLADRRSPTTARTIVNRVWQAYFGRGLVDTSEDLGSQGEAPSHPDLLDWLAVEFMDDGWSMKRLHRLIVLSSTYRQSSNISSDLLARDPYNRLLARGPRLRVEAETVRDIALAASGLLNAKVGGPSVYPPAPEFLFQPPASYGPKPWPLDTGPEQYRRALYTFRFRSVPYPVLEAFDAPNADMACVRRNRSNTPLQALATLNEPLFVACARALAMRIVTAGLETDAQRLTFAVRQCIARNPTAEEQAELMRFLSAQMKRFERGDVDPWLLAASASASASEDNQRPELPEGIAPAQLAAWTAVSRVLLNLDETITKE